MLETSPFPALEGLIKTLRDCNKVSAKTYDIREELEEILCSMSMIPLRVPIIISQGFLMGF